MPAAKLTRAVASIPMGAAGRLRLVAVADTHSSPHPAAAGHIAALAPDAILHAGDIGDVAVLERLADIAPVHAVRGNIDVRVGLPDLLVVDVGGVLRLIVFHIAVAGPRLRVDALRLARDEGASMVVCGHSHVPFIGESSGVTVFNPGSVGPRRFSLPIVFGTMDVSPAAVRLAHVDAATGQPWSPP